MKIDLHCHTKKVKKGDPPTRNTSVEVFSEKVKNADVKIVAITNHNHFDYDQYILYRKAVIDYCDVWPGIEIDAYGDSMKKGKNIKFHLIVVSNPDQAKKFDSIVQTFLNGIKPDLFEKHISDICDAFKELDVLYIPHYMGKTPAITEDDLELLRKLVPDSTRVFTETTESSIGVLVNNDFHALVGSDVKDWGIYEDSMFSDLRLPVSSFTQFCMLAKRDNVVINTILNQKKSCMYRAKPHASVNLKLQIYEDVNIIFGQKGTGKSEILNSLASEMTNDGLKCVKYVGSQKEDGFKRLLSTSGMEHNCEKLNSERCEDEFCFLEEWKDSSITLFSQYTKWFETRNNNANKKTMRITESVEMVLPDDTELKDKKTDKKNLADINKKIERIALEKYLPLKEKKQFEKLLAKLNESVLAETLRIFDSYKSVALTNYSIDKIKELADKKTDTVSKPSSTGFLEYAQSRINVKNAASKILKELGKPPFFSDEKIGELESKGDIFVRSRYRLLCQDSKTTEFQTGINKLKNIKSILEEIVATYYKSDLTSTLEKFSEAIKDASVSSVEDFIGCSKIIVDNTGNQYEPSNGEKGILLLQQVIKDDADAYLFDEPELGMGNSYIDATIRPQISDLARRHKTVVIATHNANLAVRTLPYMSIFRKYENGNYYTYVGNPFRNELINLDDEGDLLNWTVESMHTLEGGKEAFYERKDIYESGNN